MVGAEKAQTLGLVSSVVAPDALMDEATTLARKITSKGAGRCPPRSGVDVPGARHPRQADALGFESSAFGLLASTSDMKEGMQAFLEKRKAEFKGA